MGEVCKQVPYINEINRNILSLDVEQVEKALKALNEADCIILSAEGRSSSALNIGIKGLRDKNITTLENVNFPWRNLEEAISFLEKKYKKIVLLINSGSGETKTPLLMAGEMVKCLRKEEERGGVFTIVAVGSYVTSSIAVRAKQLPDGVFIKLKGRQKEAQNKEERFTYGIMNDIYELTSLLLFQKIKEALNFSRNADWVVREMLLEIKAIGEMTDYYMDSDIYRQLLGDMTRASRIILGGRGPANDIASMAAIRLLHLQRVIGRQAFLAGSFSPPPLAGDLFLAISWSGETEAVIEWARDYQKYGAKVFSIVGSDSILSRETNGLIINAPVGQFYIRAAFITSLLAIGLVAELDNYGIHIPEKLLKRLVHTRAE